MVHFTLKILSTHGYKQDGISLVSRYLLNKSPVVFLTLCFSLYIYKSPHIFNLLAPLRTYNGL